MPHLKLDAEWWARNYSEGSCHCLSSLEYNPRVRETKSVNHIPVAMVTIKIHVYSTLHPGLHDYHQMAEQPLLMIELGMCMTSEMGFIGFYRYRISFK
jgi:hypothetical protein